MNKKWVPIAVVLGGLLLVVGLLVSRYNGLVGQREAVDAAWSQVQNVLQRRADLVPNLVATVKGYAAHEKEIFEQVAAARAKLAGAREPAEAAAADAQLSGALGRLIAIAEAYPDLKANQNFQSLQDELAGTENRIAVERKRYNEVVREYNTAIQRFPTSLIAGMFGFGAKQYFQADVSAQKVPEVKF